MNIFALNKYLRLSPFDTSSDQGRTDERYRLVILSMTANVMSRGISMLVMILTVSLTLPYLGAERFGIWMTIASFVGILTFLDLGIGNALTNKVAQVATKNNPEALRQTISGGLGFLFILSIIIGALLFGIVQILPWQKLIKVNDPVLNIEVNNTVTVFAILFGLNLFTNGIQRVFSGLQRAFDAHIVSIFGSIFSLIALWIATRNEAGILYLLAATLGCQSLANLGLLIILFKRKLFTVNYFAKNTKNEARNLIKTGGLFFILQIGTMVAWGADSLIIASTLGVAQVAAFSIVQRVFQFISQPINISNAPLWGAYADADARGEKYFIRKTLKKSMLFTGMTSILGVTILILGSEQLVKFWTKDSIQISVYLFMAFGLWIIVDSISSCFAMFLNGCNLVLPQVVSFCILSVIGIPLKLWLVSHYGIEFMLVGFVGTYLLVFSFIYGIVYKKYIRNAIAE